MGEQNTQKKRMNKAGMIVAIILFIIAAGMIVLAVYCSKAELPQKPTSPQLGDTTEMSKYYDNLSEYNSAKTSKAVKIVFSSIGAVVFTIGGLITLIVASGIIGRAAKKGTDGAAYAIEKIRKAIKPEPEKNYCEYCGQLFPPKSSVCPGCGAKITKKKDS